MAHVIDANKTPENLFFKIQNTVVHVFLFLNE